MKKLFILFLLAGLGLSAQAQTDVVADDVQKEGPVMTFETTTVQYGQINKGDDPLRSVKFTNTGNQPLVITSAKGSCGCTVPVWPKEPIMPGETSQIDIRYDTKRVGPINKTVKIKTNEGDNTQHILYVKGRISNVTEEEGVPEQQPSLLAPKK